MLWVNFLHIYQPPTQKEKWIRQITEESYRKLINGMLALPRARLSLNINGVLCEFLDKYGGRDVLDGIKKLVSEERIELTGSAMYHAFLPLLPDYEVERQIALNEKTLNKYFGAKWKKGGFFSPEMAYSDKVAKIVSKMGYKWMILDEFAYPEPKKRLFDAVYKIKGIDNLNVYFRDRNFSYIISSAQVGTAMAVARYAEERLSERGYIVTAMDGETFGHHRPGLESLLFDLMKLEHITSVTISELAESKFNTVEVSPRESTWAATEENMLQNRPFDRWLGKDNIIQHNQWELTDLAIKTIEKYPQYEEGRQSLDRALHSDQYWWASAKPWWSIEMIETGAHDFLGIITNCPSVGEDDKKTRAKINKIEARIAAFQMEFEGNRENNARAERSREMSPEELRMGFAQDQNTARTVVSELKRMATAQGDNEFFNELQIMFDKYQVSNVPG